jgi:predicted phosphodiesterase
VTGVVPALVHTQVNAGSIPAPATTLNNIRNRYMRILCLADLHRWERNKAQDRRLKHIVREEEPDVIVIAGDVYEAEVPLNPFKDLSRVFCDLPVVFTLGNHEFFNKTPELVHKEYLKRYNPKRYNVHCLDIIGHYDIDDVRFVGNVLWYDGTMSTLPMQNLYSFADGSWADRLIVHFDYLRECDNCCKQIEDNLKDIPEHITTKVLVTHCVPDIRLNGHMFKASSPFNAFSGKIGYLEELREKGLGVDYAICGHTHWRIVGEEIAGTKCVNVGADYGIVTYHTLEV